MSLISKFFVSYCVLACGAAFGQDELFELQNATMIPHFLANPLVVEELDLTFEQEDVYNDMMLGLRKELASYASKAGDAQINDPILFEQLKKEYRKNLVEISELFTEDLMSHQKKRLAQVFLRYRVRRMKPGEWFQPVMLAIIDGDVSGIKLAGKQKSDFKEKLSDQRKEWIELLERHRKEKRELAEKHEHQLLELMTEEQRDLYDDALGPAVNFAENLASKTKTPKNK